MACVKIQGKSTADTEPIFKSECILIILNLRKLGHVAIFLNPRRLFFRRVAPTGMVCHILTIIILH